jgi:hypothetical protein
MITNFDAQSVLDGVIGHLKMDTTLLRVTNSFISEDKAMEDKVLEFEKVIAGNLEMIENLKEIAKDWQEKDWLETEDCGEAEAVAS